MPSLMSEPFPKYKNYWVGLRSLDWTFYGKLGNIFQIPKSTQAINVLYKCICCTKIQVRNLTKTLLFNLN